MPRDDSNVPTGTTQYASLRDYLKVIRQHRLLVAVVTLFAVGAALAYSLAQDKVYEAEASLNFREPTQDVELIGLPPIRNQTPEVRAAVGAELANRREVLEAARKQLRLRTSIDDLDADVEARAEVRTNLVVIEARAGDPRQAARIAEAVADEVVRVERADQRKRYKDLISTARQEYRRALRGQDAATRFRLREMESRLVQLRTTREFTTPVEIIEAAEASSSPVSPRPVRNTIVAGVAGLTLALLLAFLHSTLDRKLRGADELAEEANLPLLAVIRGEALGQVNFGAAQSVKRAKRDAEVDLEAFRILRMNLDYLDVDRPIRRILVTSPLAEEGKSTVAGSLAVAAGLAGRDTLLIGGDLRRPVLAERLGLKPTPGLTDYLATQAHPQEVLRTVALGGPASNGGGPSTETSGSITVLPAGTIVPRPAELLGSQRFGEFAEEVSKAYDYVIFDSAPLLSAADTLEMIDHVDAIVLCVRSEQTTRDQLRAALGALSRLPERPTGLVVTGVSRGTADDYGYYHFSYAPVRA